MASPHKFAKRMSALGQRIEDNSERLVRKVALAVDSTVVLSTPVDTGRARANWQVEISRPAQGTREAFDRSGQATIDEGRAKISGYKGGTRDAAIHITNNLPYIGKLNEGHSAQAPAGFVEKAVMIGVSAVRGAKVTVGTVKEDDTP
jgi:hypothetical protein